MNTLNGYSKSTLTDNYLLTSAGGHTLAGGYRNYSKLVLGPNGVDKTWGLYYIGVEEFNVEALLLLSNGHTEFIYSLYVDNTNGVLDVKIRFLNFNDNNDRSGKTGDSIKAGEKGWIWMPATVDINRKTFQLLLHHDGTANSSVTIKLVSLVKRDNNLLDWTVNPDIVAILNSSPTFRSVTSTVPTGVQPYACTSTTLNTNLNADLLDGVHLAGFGGAEGVMRSWKRNTYTKVNLYFGNGNVVVIDPKPTDDSTLSDNTIIFSLGDSSVRNTLLAFLYELDVIKYRRAIDGPTWKPWVTLLHSGNYSSFLDSRYYTESEANSKFLALAGGTMKGAISFNDTESARLSPMIKFGSNNLDTILWRVYSSSSAYADKGVYGFDMTYTGTGDGDANKLILYADNQNLETKVAALTVTQAGVVSFAQTVYAPSLTSASGVLTINGPGGIYFKYNGTNSQSMTLNGSAFKPFNDANGKLSLGTSDARWNGVYTSGAINSNLITSTHLEGNQGKAIINSVVGSGNYVMLAKMNSTNGYFTLGVWGSDYKLFYTSKTTVDNKTNSYTKGVTLLDESGNAIFPGEVKSKGDNGFRLVKGNYGVIHRNDGTFYYILLTDSGQALNGSWNSLRPFLVHLGTGVVSIQNLQVTQKLTALGDIVIKGSTSADMTFDGNVHPAIQFDNSDSSQKVRLIFTDYDAYRSPMGLKLVGNVSNAWFEVEGNTYSKGFVKTSSSDSYVLLGGGGHKTISSLSVGKATNLANKYSSRPSTVNPEVTGDGSMFLFKSTSSVTDETSDPGDGHILHFNWDSDKNWDTLLYLKCLGDEAKIRGMNGTGWNAWNTLLSTANSSISDYAVKINNTTKLFVRDWGSGATNMNDVAKGGRSSMGMASLSTPEGGTATAINPNGATDWHHFINISYTNGGAGSNAWITQIANKAGTTDLWIRSRNGGSVSNTTAWAAGWTRILTGTNYTQVLDSVYQAKGTYLTSHQTIYNLTMLAGAFSAVTFDPNGAAKTVNIPTKTSHLTNDSGFITATGATKLGMTSITTYADLAPVGVYGYTNTSGNAETNGFDLGNTSAAIGWGKDNCKILIAARAGKTDSEVYIKLYYLSWGNWYQLIHSGNYTSYTVEKDGTGASGTWGINVTGSAGSVAWSNVTGKPTIPSVGNGTIVVNQNSVRKGSFTLNLTGNLTIDLTDTTYTFTNKAATLAWNTTSTIATVGGVDITVKMPANPNSNSWRAIKVGDTSIAGTGTNTYALKFVQGTGITITGTSGSSTADNSITITNSGVRSVTTGDNNGTIKVNTGGTSTNISVKGLGSNAYTSTAYLPLAGGTMSGTLNISNTYNPFFNFINSGNDSGNNGRVLYCTGAGNATLSNSYFKFILYSYNTTTNTKIDKYESYQFEDTPGNLSKSLAYTIISTKNYNVLFSGKIVRTVSSCDTLNYVGTKPTCSYVDSTLTGNPISGTYAQFKFVFTGYSIKSACVNLDVSSPISLAIPLLSIDDNQILVSFVGYNNQNQPYDATENVGDFYLTIFGLKNY